MTFALAGRKALVTGATSGIGAAVARLFAQSGASIAVHGRSAQAVKAIVREVRDLVFDDAYAVGLVADLRDEDAVLRMCEEAEASLGGIDIVVNNAGLYVSRDVAGTTSALFEDLVQTNLKAPLLISKATTAAMMRCGRGGRQIFISSVGAKMSEPGGSAYCATKAAINSLVRCMAPEVGSFGITVNAVCPGWVNTKMARDAYDVLTSRSPGSGGSYETTMRGNPLGVMIEPEDIAHMVSFLASDLAACITGQAINVCGGICTQT